MMNSKILKYKNTIKDANILDKDTILLLVWDKNNKSNEVLWSIKIITIVVTNMVLKISNTNRLWVK